MLYPVDSITALPQQRGRHALVLFVFTMNAGDSCIGACHHSSNISVFWSLMRAARYLQSHTCLALSLQICYCVTSSIVDHKYLNIFTVYTFRANMWHTASRLLSSGIKVSRTITSDPISLIKTITITANFQTQSFAAPQPQPAARPSFIFKFRDISTARCCGHNIAATDNHRALFCGARPWHQPLSLAALQYLRAWCQGRLRHR